MRRTDGRKILPDIPAWETVTWEGAEYAVLKAGAAMTFRERLEWLENAAALHDAFRSAKRTRFSERIEKATRG